MILKNNGIFHKYYLYHRALSIFFKYKSFLPTVDGAPNLIFFPTYFSSILSDLECSLILKGRALLREICGDFSYAIGREYFVEKIKVGRHKG